MTTKSQAENERCVAAIRAAGGGEPLTLTEKQTQERCVFATRSILIAASIARDSGQTEKQVDELIQRLIGTNQAIREWILNLRPQSSRTTGV